MKYTHIVFGDSAGGSMKYFLKEIAKDRESKVIVIREDFSLGPIYNFGSESSIKERSQWFDLLFKSVNYEDIFYDLSNDTLKTKAEINKLKENDKIVIWHGYNTSDQIGLRYVCALLKDLDIYELDLSKIIKRDVEINNWWYTSLGMISPDEISNLIVDIEKIKEKRKIQLIKDWEEILKYKSNLRILENDKIVNVEENYYDNQILENCTFNFKRAARIIGSTMGHSKQLVGDLYIHYRVRKLIEEDKIQYRGILKSMRDFEIKNKSSLKEFFINTFKNESKIDEDGFYHYLIENKNEICIDTTFIEHWNTLDLDNKLILDYNEENLLSLTLFKDGEHIFQNNHMFVDNIQYLEEEHEIKSDEIEIRKKLIIRFQNFIDSVLEVQLEPHVSIIFKNL